MTFKLPDRDELKTLAETMGLSVDDALAENHAGAVGNVRKHL